MLLCTRKQFRQSFYCWDPLFYCFMDLIKLVDGMASYHLSRKISSVCSPHSAIPIFHGQVFYSRHQLSEFGTGAPISISYSDAWPVKMRRRQDAEPFLPPT